MGALIRARRIERRMSQQALAERISTTGAAVTRFTITRVERGRVSLPRHDLLERIAQALDMPIGELLAASVGVDTVPSDER